MKKDFITDQLGRYVNPDGNNVILGNVSSTDLTSSYLRTPTIFTAADGTTGVLPPGVKSQRIPSNTVLEMNYQMGAQVDPNSQMTQVVAAYCSVVSPNDASCGKKVMEQLKRNPEKMAQQIRQTLEQAAAQEQGQGQEQEMAKMGGCIDCQEAFPQANVYPDSWVGYTGTQYAAGGVTEAFPQAQTYLPNMRPHETRPNFMAEFGGQADLESIYRVMKAGGLNKNPRKKKGGGESFEEYMMRMGGLPKAQEGPPSFNRWQRFRSNVKRTFTGNPDIRVRNQPEAPAPPPYNLYGPDEGGSPYSSGMGPFTQEQMDYNRATSYYDQAGSTPYPTVTMDRRGNITPVPTQYEEQQRQQQAAQQQTAPGTQSNAPGAQRSSFGPQSPANQRQQAMQQAALDPGYGNAQLSAMAGIGAPSLFGRRGAAGLSLLTGALALGQSAGPRSKFSYVDPATGKRTRIKNRAADIAAAGMFGPRMIYMQGQPGQSAAPGASNTPAPTPGSFNFVGPPTYNAQGGQMKRYPMGGNAGDFQYTFENPFDYNDEPAAFVSGVAKGFTLEDQKDRLNQMRNRSAVTTSAMGPMTATKTQPGLGTAGPQGAVNAPGMLPDTGPASRPMGMFPMAPLMYTQAGGNIMDYLSDGEYDLPEDMDQDQIQELVNAIYAAGGSVEFLR